MSQSIPSIPRDFFCHHVRTIDGDSFILRPVLARFAGPTFQMAEIPVRAYGFSTPELNEPLGQDAKDQTDELLTFAKTIRIVVMGFSFARTVCEIFVDDLTLDHHLLKMHIPVTSRMTKGFRPL